MRRLLTIFLVSLLAFPSLASKLEQDLKTFCINEIKTDAVKLEKRASYCQCWAEGVAEEFGKALHVVGAIKKFYQDRSYLDKYQDDFPESSVAEMRIANDCLAENK